MKFGNCLVTKLDRLDEAREAITRDRDRFSATDAQITETELPDGRFVLQWEDPPAYHSTWHAPS